MSNGAAENLHQHHIGVHPRLLRRNAGIRRYRGYGKQILAVAVLLAASNIRALRINMSKTDATSDSPPPKPKRGRPKKPGLAG